MTYRDKWDTMGWTHIYEPYFLRSRAHAKKSVVIHSVAFIEIIEGDLNWTRKGSGSILRSTKNQSYRGHEVVWMIKFVCVFTKGQKLIKLLKKIFPSWFIFLYGIIAVILRSILNINDKGQE